MAQRGAYNTQKKSDILSYLENKKGTHVTADALVEGLKANGINIGRTTAYRHLEQMTKQGIVTRIVTGSGESDCFQYMGEGCCNEIGQMHCRCTKCGALIHVSCEKIEEMRRHFMAEHGFLLDAGRTVLCGICEKCRKGNENGSADAE